MGSELPHDKEQQNSILLEVLEHQLAINGQSSEDWRRGRDWLVPSSERQGELSSGHANSQNVGVIEPLEADKFDGGIDGEKSLECGRICNAVAEGQSGDGQIRNLAHR